MPWRVASCGVFSWTGSPSHRASYSSPGWIPAITLIRVDLPAPLSPTRATTSPAWTSKSTSVSASTAPNRLVTPLSSRSGRSGAAVVMLPSLLDSVLCTSRLIRSCANLRRLPVAVLDHGALDLVSRDRRHVERLRRHVFLAVVHLVRRVGRLLALGDRDSPFRGRVGQRPDRLVDVHVLVTGEDPLDPRDLGVLTRARDRLRVDARRLHRRNRATGGSVVCRVDADEVALADRGDRLLHLRLSLVRRPVRCVVLLGDLEARLVDRRVRALLEQLGV